MNGKITEWMWVGSVLACEDTGQILQQPFLLHPARLFSSQESSQGWILEQIEF